MQFHVLPCHTRIEFKESQVGLPNFLILTCHKFQQQKLGLEKENKVQSRTRVGRSTCFHVYPCVEHVIKWG